MASVAEQPTVPPSPSRPDRNLALELVRVTESAAMAAARWVGRGDKIAADQAAVDGMRLMLDTVSMRGVDTDLVHQLVHEHDVAAPLRDLRELPASGQVH